MIEIALAAFIALTVADGITTKIGMDRGFREVGKLASKLFGGHMQDRANILYTLARVAIGVGLYFTPIAAPALIGASVGTAHIVAKNIQALRG